MPSNFRLATMDKSTPRFLLPALAILFALACTPALAAAATSGGIEWFNMGMKLLGGLADRKSVV